MGILASRRLMQWALLGPAVSTMLLAACNDQDPAFTEDRSATRFESDDARVKAAGQDASKMSSQDKADMFDKMPADKKMKMMMAHESMMHKGGKMGKMEKP